MLEERAETTWRSRRTSLSKQYNITQSNPDIADLIGLSHVSNPGRLNELWQSEQCFSIPRFPWRYLRFCDQCRGTGTVFL